VDSLDLSNIKPIDGGFPMYGMNTWDLWGNSFEVHIALANVLNDKKSPCKLEWWERTDNIPKWQEDDFGLKGGGWNDMYAAKSKRRGPLSNSPVFPNWNNRTGHPCPGKEPLKPLTDPPSLPKTGDQSRELDFAIKVSSGPECPCSTKSIVVFAHQSLSIKNGKGVKQDFQKGGVKGPWPPNILE
jgi:hypothetical protein